MSKLIHRLRRAPSSSAKKCHIVDAPAEIRLAIYVMIAPRGFLPYTHYRMYMGLFLSCKQLHDEMANESLRAAPEILRAIQKYDVETAMKLRPLRPTDFSSLMHVTIGIPRWAFFSPETQEDIFHSLTPVLELHLSSLTIGIEDLGSEFDVYQLVSKLDSNEFLQWMEAYEDALPSVPEEIGKKDNHYEVRTTYADIVGFATAINCIVAPELCNGNHDEENYWCTRAYSMNPPPTVICNIRKVVLRLKNLHEEVPCHCGHLPHDVYQYKSVRLRWSPTDEAPQLREHGWSCLWTNESGRTKLFSKQNPAQFVWRKLPNKKPNGVLKAMKGLLKGPS